MFSLINKERLLAMGPVRFVAIFGPMLGLIFLALFSIFSFYFHGEFSMNNGLIIVSILFGVATATSFWIRLKYLS